MARKKTYRRAVIKIGTGVLTGETGLLDEERISKLVEQMACLRERSIELVVVSSGAIGSGMGTLGFKRRPGNLPELQACAAVGQVRLMDTYDKFMRPKGYHAGQVLLTREDVSDRKRYLNARNTILALLEHGVIPIINENDAVSTDEIKFGDNDRLSSLVAALVDADCLVLLSVVDGLYRFERGKGRAAEVIRRVERITRDIEACSADETSRFGLGGMSAKLQAAKMATRSGIECAIINGKRDNTLVDFFDGKEVGTLFLAAGPAIKGRKRWIAHSSKVSGGIVVDDGARDALVGRNRSLLSSGIVDARGDFDTGAVVSIMCRDGKEFARGLTNYSSSEIDKIKGLKSGEIEKRLGYKYYDEVVHRDNLVVL